jgi:hypothetical protein
VTRAVGVEDDWAAMGRVRTLNAMLLLSEPRFYTPCSSRGLNPDHTDVPRDRNLVQVWQAYMSSPVPPLRHTVYNTTLESRPLSIWVRIILRSTTTGE